MRSCQKKPQLRFPTALAAPSKVMIKPTRATTQEQEEEEKKKTGKEDEKDQVIRAIHRCIISRKIPRLRMLIDRAISYRCVCV